MCWFVAWNRGLPRQFSCCVYGDANQIPFLHESNALTTELAIPAANLFQHMVIDPQQAVCAPRNVSTFLPDEMKKLGYATHIVGKWVRYSLRPYNSCTYSNSLCMLLWSGYSEGEGGRGQGVGWWWGGEREREREREKDRASLGRSAAIFPAKNRLCSFLSADVICLVRVELAQLSNMPRAMDFVVR